MKIIIISALSLISLSVKSQVYYACDMGMFSGKAQVYNYNIRKNETINYSGFYFNMPIGAKNLYNVLYEINLGYNGYFATSGNVGYQIGEDKPVNLQILAGIADNIEILDKLKTKHYFSYNTMYRFNIGHFFISGRYSDKTYYFGIGLKAYVYE